jgi:hypothetical protein
MGMGPGIGMGVGTASGLVLAKLARLVVMRSVLAR